MYGGHVITITVFVFWSLPLVCFGRVTTAYRQLRFGILIVGKWNYSNGE